MTIPLSRRFLWTDGAICVVALLAACWFYDRLPHDLPSQWDIGGHVTATVPKWPGAFMLPALMVFCTLLLPLLPAISPRHFEIEADSRAYTNPHRVSLRVGISF